MGQKVNPIAVRLNFNRFSDSSWFSDYYYSTLIYQDFNFRQYLHLLRKPNTNKLGFRSAKCIIHHFPKRSLVHLFCLSDPRKKTGNLLQQSRLRASPVSGSRVIVTDSPNATCASRLGPTSVSNSAGGPPKSAGAFASPPKSAGAFASPPLGGWTSPPLGGWTSGVWGSERTVYGLPRDVKLVANSANGGGLAGPSDQLDVGSSESVLRAKGRIPGTNTSMAKWLREEESGRGSRSAPETGSFIAPSSDLLREVTGDARREPVTNAPLVAPKARQHGPGSRAALCWLKSSIFQKKRALVNLHRLLSSASDQYPEPGPSEQHIAGFVPLSCSKRRKAPGAGAGWFRKAGTQGACRFWGNRAKREPLRGRLGRFSCTGNKQFGPTDFGSIKHADPHTRFPGLWPWFGPGTGNSGRPIFCQNVRQQLRDALCVSNKALCVGPWFNFYAIHYFFMQKMGDSLGRLPHRIVNAGGTRPGFLGGFAACSQTLDQPVPGPLTYRPNSIWPTIRVRHFSPNRTSRVLCLDRRRRSTLKDRLGSLPILGESRPFYGLSLDTHILGADATLRTKRPQRPWFPAPAEPTEAPSGWPLSAHRVDAFSGLVHRLRPRGPGRGALAKDASMARSDEAYQNVRQHNRDTLKALCERTRGTVGSAPSAQRASNLVCPESLQCTTPLRRPGNRVNEWSSFFGSVGSNQITKSLDFYLSNVHYILSQNTNTFISMRPIKVHSVFQCASLVAQEVACKLEQKKSFRLICRLIFQQLTVCNYIKGIRITCSGRLNGAEIAKTECRKFGETSLHVFSDKIDYARTKASTPYGILGVKVWISYI